MEGKLDGGGGLAGPEGGSGRGGRPKWYIEQLERAIFVSCREG